MTQFGKTSIQMQTLTRMDKVVFGELPYHNNGWKHKVDEINASIVIFSLNCRAYFCTSTFTSKSTLAYLNVHTREKWDLPLMNTMYANASNSMSFYTDAILYVVWRVHPLGFKASHMCRKVIIARYLHALQKTIYILCIPIIIQNTRQSIWRRLVELADPPLRDFPLQLKVQVRKWCMERPRLDEFFITIEFWCLNLPNLHIGHTTHTMQAK